VSPLGCGGPPAGGKALKVAAAVGMRSLYRRTGGRRRTATKKGHRHGAGGAYSGARPPESQGSAWKRSTTHNSRKKNTAVCCEKGFEKRGMIGATACTEKKFAPSGNGMPSGSFETSNVGTPQCCLAARDRLWYFRGRGGMPSGPWGRGPAEGRYTSVDTHRYEARNKTPQYSKKMGKNKNGRSITG